MSRNRLHRSKLAEFEQWLDAQGWKKDEVKGEWEVLRMVRGDRTLIVHTRKHEPEHLTLHGDSEEWFTKFMDRPRLIRQKDAAEEALDEIAKLCGCPEWEYPGQVVRDVQTALSKYDRYIRPFQCRRCGEIFGPMTPPEIEPAHRLQYCPDCLSQECES